MRFKNYSKCITLNITKMETIKVHSSFIDAIQYSANAQRLKVVIGSTAYFYYGITKQKIARLKKAASKGGYFCKYIKGKYQMIRRKIR